MEEITSFFNSNFFIALATFIVGGFAIGLYKKQKKDQKRDAAKLILQEIRYAEQQIRIASERNYIYRLADLLLPTNNWNNNINLFIKELKETEIDLISKFYANATYLDILIRKISKIKTESVILVNGQPPRPPQPAQPPVQPIQPPRPPQPAQPVQIPQIELQANQILKDVSSKIELLYNTPAADKLRKISEKKWYHII